MSKKKFEIEKVKWSWAKPVASKDVYRDDEFVRSKSKEEAIEAIDFLMCQPKGLTYTITVLRDEEYFTYYRHSMPCLGGLVKYRDSHGEKHFMNSYFPRDIRVAFPEGEVIFIACQGIPKSRLKSPYWEFMFSAESPWVNAFGSKDTILFRDSYFILTNMKTDPTTFYSLMRLGGLVGWHPATYDKWHPKAQILATKSGQADPRRLAAQKPILISGGTWAEGYGYTRPYNESIFKTMIPTPYAEFGKLAGYPQAAYTNTFFNAEMKSVFGIDLSKGILATEKYEKALVEAWDYFKIRAEMLDDQAGDAMAAERIRFIHSTINPEFHNLAITLMNNEHQLST
jgi:hypothetical protein